MRPLSTVFDGASLGGERLKRCCGSRLGASSSDPKLLYLQGFSKKPLQTNLFCPACKQAGMKLHNLFHEQELNNETRVLIEFLQAIPILGFCGSHDEVGASVTIMHVICWTINHPLQLQVLIGQAS